jgi:DNA-binding protein HU-beta
VTKAEFITELAKKTGSTKKDAEKFFEAFVDVISATAKKGDTIRLQKLGTFKVVTRKERTARNPRTGKTIKVPKKKVLRFSPSSELRFL